MQISSMGLTRFTVSLANIGRWTLRLLGGIVLFTAQIDFADLHVDGFEPSRQVRHVIIDADERTNRLGAIAPWHVAPKRSFDSHHACFLPSSISGKSICHGTFLN